MTSSVLPTNGSGFDGKMTDPQVEKELTATAPPGSFSCLCLNVQLFTSGPPDKTAIVADEDVDTGLANLYALSTAEDNLQVVYSSFVTRDSLQIEGQSCASLKCQHCKTHVYAVRKAAPSGPQKTVGFDAPSAIRDQSVGSGASTSGSGSRERGGDSSAAVLRPADGHVWVLPATLNADGINEARRSRAFSFIYGVCLAPDSEQALQASANKTSHQEDEEPSSDVEGLIRGRNWTRRSSVTRNGIGAATLPSMSASTSALPPIPASILQSPPPSPNMATVVQNLSASLTSRYRSPTRAPTAAVDRGAIGRTNDETLTQLETQAMRQIKKARADADREVQALVRKHTESLQKMQAQAESHGRFLLAEMSGKSRIGATGSQGIASSFRSASWFIKADKDRRRRSDTSISTLQASPAIAPSPLMLAGESHLQPAPENKRQDSNEDVFGNGGRYAADEEEAESSQTPIESFSRRKPTITSASMTINRSSSASNVPSTLNNAPTFSSSLSALSASFAMRGRDPPTPPVITSEDWAAKKRLRERYPEGDHSALNSEVNSLVNSEESSEVDEEPAAVVGEREPDRGRMERGAAERGRSAERETRGRARDTRPLTTPEEGSRDGYAERAPAPASLRLAGKTGASQAQLSKAIVATEKQAGQSGEILLKPRGPPPSGTEPLKPATRQARPQPTKGKPSKGQRKSVAFAETTENVEGRPIVEEEEQQDREGDVALELVDESDSAVFEIDEDVEREETSLAPEKFENVGNDQPIEDVLGSPPDDGPEDPNGADAASISASLAQGGSLSAIAAAHSLRTAPPEQWNEPNFDPSSLRVEDFYTSRRGVNDVARSTTSSTAEATYREKVKSTISIGEAEARLGGLLAQHAPSHRNLWTRDHGKKASKFGLNEEADQKWAAWKDRVRRKEAEDAAGSLEDAGDIQQSLSSDDSSPRVGLAIKSSRVGFSSIVHDGSSGFDREPKTSLPYGERLLVPSLRKAMRRSSTAFAPRLTTIADNSPQLPQATLPASLGQRMAEASASARIALAGGVGQQVLPSSVSQHGFSVSQGGSGDSPSPAAASSELKTPSVKPPPSVLAGMTKRTPRAPYVPPPPPVTSNLVLKPDPAQLPRPLALFDSDPDTDFAPKEGAESRVPSENDLAKTLAFMHRIEMLKRNKRTGWIHHRASQPESIADHMYRMAILAMLCPADDVDIGKCVMLALVHDLAEAEVGDLTPLDNVPKEEKLRREREAIAYFTHDLLESSPAALRMEKLWHEYEDRETKESKLVKDLDRFELCLQALEYERVDDIRDLQPFFSSSINLIRHPRQRLWAKQLAIERQKMWALRGLGYEQTFQSHDVR